MKQDNAPKANVFLANFKRAKFSRPQLVIFVLAFAVIGFLIFKSFATAPLVASIEAERMTATAPVVASGSFTTNITAGQTISTPYMWDFNPGVATSAGYFFADGHMLKKINGPGPYAFRLDNSTLSAGAHQLGHAWDTTSGLHKTPSASYSVSISPTTKTGFVTTLSNGLSITPPYTWSFDPGVSTNAGYFFADGHLLQKITGQGPYVLTLTPAMLSTGAHQLGHSWDTAAGQHQTPSSAYSVNISNPVSQTTTNYSVISDTSASGGQAMKFAGGVTLNGSVSLPTAATSLTILAHGEQCGTIWPQMTVAIDGTQVINSTVSSASWSNYSANVSLGSGSHSLVITNSSTGSCLPNLYADVTNFYGPVVVTPAPTVSLSVSPTSVTAGSSATLTWSSTNATLCTASGAWSGTPGLSGSQSTGALNQNSTYNLTCTGAGGSAVGSAAVTVTPVTTTTSYDAATSYSAPAFTATRTIDVSSQSAFMTAWNNIQPGDLIKVHGVTFSGEISLLGKNLTSDAEIDFDSATKFLGPTSNQYPAVWISNDSHIRFFGGDITSIGTGIYLSQGSYILWYGFNTHNTGGGGMFLTGAYTSAIDHADIKGEVSNWSLDNSLDPHSEKGTGLHGINVADSKYGVRDSRIAIYAHDGPGGAGMEIGGSGSSDGAWNNTIYMHCVNLTMHAISQVAGNCVQVWGDNVLNNNFKYIEAENLQGRPYDANGLYSGQSLSSNTVVYGLASNTNLNTSLSSTESSIPANMHWDTRGSTVFQNVSPTP